MRLFLTPRVSRIWDEEKLEEIQKLSFHTEKKRVGVDWGPYFLKTNASENITVNVDRYHAMKTDYLMPEIEASDLTYKYLFLKFNLFSILIAVQLENNSITNSELNNLILYDMKKLTNKDIHIHIFLSCIRQSVMCTTVNSDLFAKYIK